ncbi:hypothetical protein [Rhizobium changzhiense]|uniref:Uncharacterized protein n=1 Tax=Rhizobium changzhiense TaxID=2692317 RepID=A0ABR6A191_9HYPH|nr:hypothetical protein [Rhizobium changzhiense]MBA5800316.1 hypothetical protein [Rhizobium changzhiense]
MEKSENKTTKPASGDAPRRRPGLPDPTKVVGERDLLSPKGKRYKIIRTRECDAYDKPDDS